VTSRIHAVEKGLAQLLAWSSNDVVQKGLFHLQRLRTTLSELIHEHCDISLNTLHQLTRGTVVQKAQSFQENPKSTALLPPLIACNDTDLKPPCRSITALYDVLLHSRDQNPRLRHSTDPLVSTMISSTAKASLSTMTRPCRLRAPSHTRISAIRPQNPRLLSGPTSFAQRQFSQSARATYPRKDTQDKDSINTESSEYSKSATDDEGARQQDAAFNPDVTDPQAQKDLAGEGTGEGTVSGHVLVAHASCAAFDLRASSHSSALCWYLAGNLSTIGFRSSPLWSCCHLHVRLANVSILQDTNNPLEVSPANPEVSKTRGGTEGGAENSSHSSGTTSDRKRSSGGGGPPKGSKVA